MLELIDVQVGFDGTQPGRTTAVECHEVLDYCNDMRLAAALVRTEPVEADPDVLFSNRRLFDACTGQERLIPCPVVLPNSGKELATENEQIDQAIANGAAAVTIRPVIDYWVVLPWISDALFRALVDRNLPVWISSHHCPPPQIAEIAAAFPDLRIILAQVGYREQRILLPLLKRFPQVYLSIGNNYCLHQGLEQLVKEVECRQLLFGSGFPESEPMAAVMMLLNSDLSLEQKQCIGFGNFNQLREEIR
ncbi:amidohydrolase family protein [candidate division KSB1 bacterium]|nr:amidohydrolase family protein [candidate division KSB1 bacterium]